MEIPALNYAGGGRFFNVAPPPAEQEQDNLAEWSAEEQAILEEAAAEPFSGTRVAWYLNIAARLIGRTAKEVALRLRWTAEVENNLRREEEERLAERKERKRKRKKKKEEKEEVTESELLVRPEIDYTDGFTIAKIGGVTRELLEKNQHMMTKISENTGRFHAAENRGLIKLVRENLIMLKAGVANSSFSMPLPELPVFDF